jgi:hypothetical protein
MRKRYAHLVSLAALASLGSMVVAAVPQANPSTDSTQEKSPPAGARLIPTVKCIDQDSTTACKSFKQLVDARDARIIKATFGEDGHEGKHFSYVCFNPKGDAFVIVYFDMPKRTNYGAYWSGLSDKAIEQLHRKFEKRAAFNDKLPEDSAIPDQWYDDHSSDKAYAFSSADLQTYENGIFTDWVMDYGKWRMPVDGPHQEAAAAQASFEGAWAWLEHLTAQSSDRANLGDDPREGHITIDESAIYARYSFKNSLDTLTRYSLSIQRSTGRFTETFEAPGVPPNEESGACWMFRE